MSESFFTRPTKGVQNRGLVRTLRKKDQDGFDGGDVSEDADVEDREQTGEEPTKIVCGACRHELTTDRARTEVDGGHRHVKVNPHGNVFHIRCFQPVPGVVAIGQPSSDFSWFSGYRWQISLCRSCQVHVGWTFSGDGEFSALIEGRIAEEDQEN